jgi:hypothetical protein
MLCANRVDISDQLLAVTILMRDKDCTQYTTHVA